ncbi:hypothetical protein ENSA5_57670 [Enhygromyxa salina]|uniref:Lipoprotein n=1 Tax=Enhygromyxa salina TaxID=215803 RepID=A0A2S9XEA8_9BACT|nr:hypothetical protein [Enhygromyxa salina]PRP91195.1 hypothetical protein ENSA5_57670 [Enhygromyxa salina]
MPRFTTLPSSAVLVAVFLASACSGSSPGAEKPDETEAEAKPASDGNDSPAPKPAPKPEPVAQAPRVDLSTDEAVGAAYEDATGKELDRDGRCIGRPDIGDVIVVGGFTYDVGCELEGAFVGGVFVDRQALFEQGLALAGWADLPAAERPAFALQWAEEVVFHWAGDFISRSSKAFEFKDTPSFTAPTARAKGDEVVVRAWVQKPPGMMDLDAFDLVELRVASDGALSMTRKDEFAVDGPRLR